MEDGSRKEVRDHKGGKEEAPPESSAAVWLDHGSTQESACEQAGQGRESQVRLRSAPCLRAIRPPSTSENSRHCQLTVQLDGENIRAGDDAGG